MSGQWQWDWRHAHLGGRRELVVDDAYKCGLGGSKAQSGESGEKGKVAKDFFPVSSFFDIFSAMTPRQAKQSATDRMHTQKKLLVLHNYTQQPMCIEVA